MNNEAEEMMDPTEHPQDQLILNYVKAPESAEFHDLRLHLASCRFCRRRSELTAILREQGHWLESEQVDVDMRMADLMAAKLSAEQATEFKNELKQDPVKLRAALHYASHARAMDELKTATRDGMSIWDATQVLLLDWLGFRAPIWKTVPIVAVLMVLGLLGGQYIPAEQTGAGRIIAYNDNPAIQIVGHETQPGIGFFAQQGENTIPYAGIKVEMIEDNRLRLTWPEVETALSYNLKLQVFREGETRVLARQSLTTTSVDLEMSEPLTQHRYEWVLSGDTSDNRSFQASGGFVIARD